MGSDSPLSTSPPTNTHQLSSLLKPADTTPHQTSSRVLLLDTCPTSSQSSAWPSLSSCPSHGPLCTVLLLPPLVCSDASQLPSLLTAMDQSLTMPVESPRCPTLTLTFARELTTSMLLETPPPPSAKDSPLDLHASSVLPFSEPSSPVSLRLFQMPASSTSTSLSHSPLLDSLLVLCFHTGSLPSPCLLSVMQPRT